MDQNIGRYRILEEIASGSQGAVYRGFDPQEGRIVALKVLHPSLTADPAYLERFHREAQIAVSINHPNVVKVFEVGESAGRHFIAMEFLPESLARILDTGDVLPVSRAVQFAAQIAEGLAAAHALGIVHRDVKPQNVLIGPNGEAKVTDFGIARAAALSNMTATGMIMGTPYYMSPEQANGQPTDARSDLYSLGCVLYQMLAGELPFEGTTPLVVLRRQVEETPRSIRSIRSDVPTDVAGAVEKAMAKDPAQRFQSMSELIAVLQSSVPGLPQPITQTGSTVPAPGRALPGSLPTLANQPLSLGSLRGGWWINDRWRNKYLLGGALVSLVAVMVAVGIWTEVLPFQPPDPTPTPTPVIVQPPGSDTDVPGPTIRSGGEVTAGEGEQTTTKPAVGVGAYQSSDYVEGKVLFEDNFESGFAQNWDLSDEGLAVIQDANGNYVLQANGTAGSLSAVAGDNAWGNYALEFTAKFLETTSRSFPAQVNVSVRQKPSAKCDWYSIQLYVEVENGTAIERFRMKDNECITERLAGAPAFSLAKDRWYSIRVEALGPRITVYVDGQLLMLAENTEPNLSGAIWFHIFQGHIVHYDDVRVVELFPTDDFTASVAVDPIQARGPNSRLGPVVGKVLFEDNFENGFAESWNWITDGFSVVQDQSGNYVLQSTENSGFASVGDASWEDYSLAFRVKAFAVAGTPFAPIGVLVRNSGGECEGYAIDLTARDVKGSKIRNVCGEFNLASADTFSPEIDQWYSVHIDVLGPRITVFVDGELLIFAEVPEPILSGAIIFSTPGNNNVQYDDIRVIQLLSNENSTPTQNPVEYIPIIDAHVSDLRFFGTPHDTTPHEDRIYADSFEASTTGFIAWELTLTHPSPDRRIDYVIDAVYYHEGNLIGRDSHRNAFVQPDWTNSWQDLSYGSETPGYWPVGNYRVDLFVESKLVVSGEFEVLRDAPKEPTPVPAPETTEGRVLFQDDFDDGFARNWDYISDEFSVVRDLGDNFVLEAIGPARRYPTAQVGDTTWEDYAVEFNVRYLEDADDVSWDFHVNVREASEPCRYNVWFSVWDASGVGLERRGSSPTCGFWRLDSVNAPALVKDQWYSVRIEAVGPAITVYLDGKQILYGVDDQPLLSGPIQLLGGPGAIVQYDDVRVVELIPP